MNEPLCDECGVEMDRFFDAPDTNCDGYACPECGWSFDDVDLSKPPGNGAITTVYTAKPRNPKIKVKEMPTVTYTTTKRQPRGKKNREFFLSQVGPKIALHLMDVGEAEGLTAEEFTLIIADMLQSQIRLIIKKGK